MSGRSVCMSVFAGALTVAGNVCAGDLLSPSLLDPTPQVTSVVAPVDAGAAYRDLFATLGQSADTGTAESSLGISFVVDNTIASKYVWRGIRSSDGPVWQPAASASWEGLALWGWGNMDLTDDGANRNRFTEIDWGVKYARSIGDFNLSAGFINYQFPNSAGSTTTEVYGAVGYSCWFTPTVTLYQDIDQNRGEYATLSVEHLFEGVLQPTKDISVDASVNMSVAYGSAAYNLANYGTDTAGFTDAAVTVGLPVHLGKSLTLTPSVSGAQLLDYNIRNSMPGGSSTFWGSLTLSYKF